MRNHIIAILSSATLSALAYGIFASPAATQNWVRNYVSTNNTASASYSNAVSRATLNAEGLMQSAFKILAEGGSVSNAVSQSISEATAIVGPIMDACVGF